MISLKFRAMKTIMKILGVVYDFAKMVLKYGQKYFGAIAVNLPFVQKSSIGRTIRKGAVNAIKHIPLSRFKLHLN
jgi:hypothetical protein